MNNDEIDYYTAPFDENHFIGRLIELEKKIVERAQVSVINGHFVIRLLLSDGQTFVIEMGNQIGLSPIKFAPG